MSINKLTSKSTGAISYKAVLKHSHKVPKTKTFKLKKDARKWLQNVQVDEQLIRSFQQPKSRMLFCELVAEYEDAVPTKDHSRKQHLKFWSEKLNKTLSLIDADAIEVALNGLVVAAATRNRYKAALSSVFIYAVHKKNKLGQNNYQPGLRKPL